MTPTPQQSYTVQTKCSVVWQTQFNLLCIGKSGLCFVKFRFIVECHQINMMLGCILNVWCLLARIGVNDSRGIDIQIKNFLNLTLIRKITLIIGWVHVSIRKEINTIIIKYKKTYQFTSQCIRATKSHIQNSTNDFYRAMHFSAKRGIAIACRLSVRPSVRPSVGDVGELWSHRLEFFKNNLTVS